MRSDATDPVEVMRGRLAELTDAFTALARTADIADTRTKFDALSDAERAAVSRWAVPAGEAFARAAADILKLDNRLRQIVGIDPGDSPA